MTDPALLRRLDAIVVVVAVWLLLTLVLGSFALMLVDVAVGVLALGTVVLFAVVAALSYLRAMQGYLDSARE